MSDLKSDLARARVKLALKTYLAPYDECDPSINPPYGEILGCFLEDAVTAWKATKPMEYDLLGLLNKHVASLGEDANDRIQKATKELESLVRVYGRTFSMTIGDQLTKITNILKGHHVD